MDLSAPNQKSYIAKMFESLFLVTIFVKKRLQRKNYFDKLWSFAIFLIDSLILELK